MTTQIDITIRLERMKQNWFLWAEDETGNSLPFSSWKQHAFTWHSSSFYGTLLQEGTYEQRSGIILNATQAFEYIAKKPVNSFTNLQISAAISELAPIAEKMWEAYRAGDFLPDIKQWHQHPSWKIAHEEIIDETVQTLFSEAINETLRHHTRSGEAWEDAKRLYEHYDFTKRQLETAIHENDWLRKIGYIEDDLPFAVGLRLQEPENDFETWQLETILTPKRGTHRIYVYTDAKSLPKRWLNHEARITETQEGFGKLVPWLIEDDIFRNELYEAEAWRFLTEASNELLAAGIDILLPSWWQNLKANKPKLRVQVKHNAKAGQAFFGMNTLVDFDWRISTNGINLSEVEFLALIEQNRRLIHINGQWMRLDPAFIEEVKKLMKKADKYGLEMKDVVQQRLLRGAETEVVEEESPFADMEIELDDYYDKLFERLLHIGEIPSIQVPTSLQATLRPYQQQGVEWLLYLRELGFGALLADDMGLGSAKRSYISVS